MDNEEYEKHRVFKIVLGEPEIVQSGDTNSDALALLRDGNDRLSQIIQAGMAALG